MAAPVFNRSVDLCERVFHAPVERGEFLRDAGAHRLHFGRDARRELRYLGRNGRADARLKLALVDVGEGTHQHESGRRNTKFLRSRRDQRAVARAHPDFDLSFFSDGHFCVASYWLRAVPRETRAAIGFRPCFGL